MPRNNTHLLGRLSSLGRSEEAPASAQDELLMVRYQRGDRDAFKSIVRRHQRGIYNFVLRQTRDASAAEEIAQEVFLRVVQNASQFKHEARFSTWLFTIARNLCVDHHRRQKHRRHASLDQPAGVDSERGILGDRVRDPHFRSNVERMTLSSEARESILAALAELPEEQREVFLLREIANLPFADIAEITMSGQSTVKSRMRYALERLQRALSEFSDGARRTK